LVSNPTSATTFRHSAAGCAGNVKPVESSPTLFSICSTVIVPQPNPPVPQSHVSGKQQIQPIVPSSLPLTRIRQADAPSQTKRIAASKQGSARADNKPDATVIHITLPSLMPHVSRRVQG
jgi:hypothetical protein